MKTHPYPEVTIDAPVWMREKYKKITGKTMEERYKEMTEILFLNILEKVLKKYENTRRS